MLMTLVSSWLTFYSPLIVHDFLLGMLADYSQLATYLETGTLHYVGAGFSRGLYSISQNPCNMLQPRLPNMEVVSARLSQCN